MTDNSERFGVGRSGWRPTTYTPNFPSLVHPPDRFSHQNLIQPEILLAAMAAASTAQQALNERRNVSHLQNLASLNNLFTCPNCTFSTQADLLSMGNQLNLTPNQNQSRQQQSFKRSSYTPQQFVEAFLSADKNRSFSLQEFAPNNFLNLPLSSSPNLLMMQRQLQKTRKPYFMPYISEGAMLRGLKNGDFIKGILHINRQNYEESYIEHMGQGNGANGDNIQNKKIMIISVHDRNRALHGDEVVIRVKDRSEWMVRESLYRSWRAGELNELFDENGQPISVPPVSANNNDEKTFYEGLLQFLPSAFHKQVTLEKIDDVLPVPKKNRYSRSTVLHLGIQAEYQRRKLGKKYELPADVLQTIKSLSIYRDSFGQKFDTNGNHCILGNTPFNGGRYHISGHGAQRITYRLLADMADEDWGIPDICLQKTAEVVYVFKSRNPRAAVGQLKVMADGNRNWALFSPTDSRMPRMMVPADQLPNGFFERSYEFSKLLYIAQIVEWPATAQFARGKLVKQVIGTEHDAETEALIAAARGEDPE